MPVKKPLGGVGGANPSDCKSEASDRLRLIYWALLCKYVWRSRKKGKAPVASEALRSKVSLRPSLAVSVDHR